jgi:hypothetical protein
MRKLISLLFLLAFSNAVISAQQYDLVLVGGRVMDPETGVDAVRNVAIRDGKIARISAETLSGRRVIHAKGLVVAPGFIDLHQHGQNLVSQRVKALDGVTTALARWRDRRRKPKGQRRPFVDSLRTAAAVAARSLVFERRFRPRPAKSKPASPRSCLRAVGNRSTGHARTNRAHQGAFGNELTPGWHGMGIQHAGNPSEVIDMFRLAAERRLPVYTHAARAASSQDLPLSRSAK